jgi:hypothetical protein
VADVPGRVTSTILAVGNGPRLVVGVTRLPGPPHRLFAVRPDPAHWSDPHRSGGGSAGSWRHPDCASRAMVTRTYRDCYHAPRPHRGGGWGIRTPEGFHPTRFPSAPRGSVGRMFWSVCAGQRTAQASSATHGSARIGANCYPNCYPPDPLASTRRPAAPSRARTDARLAARGRCQPTTGLSTADGTAETCWLGSRDCVQESGAGRDRDSSVALEPADGP